MRLIFISIAAFFFLHCTKSTESNSASPVAAIASSKAEASTEESSPTPATKDQSSGLAGSLVLSLQPKEGAPATSVANAKLIVDGHPEITGTSDASGNVTISNLLPGTLTLSILSTDVAALTEVPSQYGLRIPDVVIKAGLSTDLGTKVLKETGSISGTVSFLSNPNNLTVLGTQIFLPGTNFSTFAAENGTFKMSGIPEGIYDLYAMHDGFATVKSKDIQVQEGTDTTIGDLALSLSNGPEGSISVVATTSATIVNDIVKIETTPNRTVTFNLIYDSDAALMKISDEPAFLNKEWTPVSKQGSMTFTSDGLKTIYVMFSDLNGLESSPYFDRVYIDTEAPVLSEIKILNGWAQTATANLIIDITATDSSTGVSEIQFQGCTLPDSTSGAWHPYLPSLSCVLDDSTAGLKTVTAKIRDYAGRESAIATDNITKGTTTLIHSSSYTKVIDLLEDQQPYFIDENVSFAKGLTLRPGVTLKVSPGRTITVKGPFMAQGSAVKPIVLEQANFIANGTCNQMSGFSTGFTFDMSANEPDATSSSKVSYVAFNAATLNLAGGTFSHSTFESGCASGYQQSVKKYGLDPLVIEDSTFHNISTAIEVQNGINSTTFRRNTGTVNSLLTQAGNASGTVLTGNTMQILGGFLYSTTNGSFTSTGNSFTGTVYSMIAVENSETSNLGTFDQGPTLTSNGTFLTKSGVGTFNLSNISVSNCPSFANLSGNGNVNLSNVTISNCAVGITMSADMMASSTTKTLQISNSTIGVTSTLVVYYGNNSNYTVNIHDSAISCTNNTNFCDLTFRNTPSSTMHDTLNLTNNQITCNGNADHGCRGFAFYKVIHSAHSGANATFNLTMSGNTWIGKSPASPIATFSAQATAYNDLEALFNDTTSDATAVKIFKIDVPGYEMGLTVTAN